MNKRIAFFCLFWSLLVSASAFADTSSTTTETVPSNVTSTTSTPSVPFDLTQFYLGYYGTIEGSKLSQLGSSHQVSMAGAMTTQPMFAASDVTAAYMVTHNIGVGTYIEFNETPLLGQGFQLIDVGVTAFNQKLVSSNGLTIYGNAIVEAPTSSWDINRGMFVGLETTPYIRYDIPNSRFTLGAWTELKNYTGANSGKLIKTYYNPYVSYQLLPMLAANVGYEMEFDKFAGVGGFSVQETDFQPGIIWNITHRVLLNPYLQFFTNNRLTYDSVAFGAAIVARVL